jgi:hypothetical protein
MGQKLVNRMGDEPSACQTASQLSGFVLWADAAQLPRGVPANAKHRYLLHPCTAGARLVPVGNFG